MSATAERADTPLEVSVEATPLPTDGADALEVFLALRDRLGDEEVFLLEDLHRDQAGQWQGSVVGIGRLAEITVTGLRVRATGTGPVANALRAHCARHTRDGSRLAGPSAVWDLLRGALNLFRVHTAVPTSRFAFGFLTSVAYDAAALMEDLRPREAEPDVPDLTVTLFQRTIWFDRRQRSPVVLTASGPDLPVPFPLELSTDVPFAPAAVPDAPAALSVHDTVDRAEFLGWVQRCLDHIRVGDVYQIQVGHRIDIRSRLGPTGVYQRLRARNPSPYMYFVTQAGVTLIGASPEVLFRIQDGRVVMRPIAGTTRRDPTGADNERRVEELVSSVKEQAEHIMLVDLSRNDVSRVCRPGSLAVDALMAVEEFSHVFHLVSTVSGQLTAQADVWDTLRATFPAGTVTGAPKIRAMQIIDETERERRGMYAGAVGLLDVRGWSELALCIRTIVHRRSPEPDGDVHHYSTQSCAGVVALSEPKREWDETLAKMSATYWAVTGNELA